MKKQFYIVVALFMALYSQAQVGISQAEYFWDTDPGQGSATAVVATDGNFNSAFEELSKTGIAAPSIGLHKFCIRVKDNTGIWGPVFTNIIKVTQLTTSTTVSISQAEYFWDTDPGVGNGGALFAVDGNFDAALEQLFHAEIPLSLSVGLHVFNVRVKDNTGVWGPAFKNVVKMGGALSDPMTAAPNPTLPQTQVISMFSNVYVNVPVDTWKASWSLATLADIQITGNDTKKYTNLNYVGIETVANTLNITGMTHFNLNVWSPDFTVFKVKLVDLGANGIFGGGDDVEHEITFNAPAQSQWITYHIPISNFTNLVTRQHIGQLILASSTAKVYIDNAYFSTDMPAAAGCFQNAAAGYDHALAVKGDGSLWAWGNNDIGELGDNTTINKLWPKQIGTAMNWQSVSAGNYYSLGIKTDGTLWGWGWNNGHQLGDGTTNARYTPIQIGTATNWKSVSAGTYHVMAIKTDGTLWGWAANNYGQLGNGTYTQLFVPTQIGTASNWKSVSAGYYFTTAIKTDGTLWAWGQNDNGQLGDGTLVQKKHSGSNRNCNELVLSQCRILPYPCDQDQRNALGLGR